MLSRGSRLGEAWGRDGSKGFGGLVIAHIQNEGVIDERVYGGEQDGPARDKIVTAIRSELKHMLGIRGAIRGLLKKCIKPQTQNTHLK